MLPSLQSASWKSREPGCASRCSQESFQTLPAPRHGIGVSGVIHLAVVLVWGHDTWRDMRGHLAPQHTPGLPWLWAPPQEHSWRKRTLLPIQILLAGPHTVPGDAQWRTCTVLVLKQEQPRTQLWLVHADTSP